METSRSDSLASLHRGVDLVAKGRPRSEESLLDLCVLAQPGVAQAILGERELLQCLTELGRLRSLVTLASLVWQAGNVGVGGTELQCSTGSSTGQSMVEGTVNVGWSIGGLDGWEVGTLCS